MSDPEEKDDAHKAPPGAGDRADVTIEIDPASPTLRPLGARYDLLAEVGRGGMGIVYKARDKETGEVVALKVLQPEIAARPDLIERFKSELLLARKVTHKNVCRTYDLHRFGATAAIAMEYVEGESLRPVLNRYGPLSVRKGVEWASQICAALIEAHAQGVIHRDLKPENIVVARDGTVKVMDFGIARSLETGATQTGALIGTPAYMSPEQAEGKPVDHRSDIYSLGLILYEMFTGRAAFQSDTPTGALLQRLHESPPPPSTVEPDLPERLSRAIAKCLERKREKRFQSVAELEAALTKKPEARAVAGEAGDVPLPLHLTRWQRSDWLLLPLAAAGLLLFFSFFEGSSLAPRSKVAFDRGALLRIAQEYAQRAGGPVSKDYRIDVEPSPERYEYLATTAGAQAASELANNPVPYWDWLVEWQHPDRRPTEVDVDNRGSLTYFNRDFPADSGKETLSVEVTRPLAEKALADFFNADASRLRLESAFAGTRGDHPSTNFTWVEPKGYFGFQPRYTVRLVGREIAALVVNHNPPASYQWRYPLWQMLPVLALMLVVSGLGLYQRRQVELAARWRATTTAFMFVGGSWLIWRGPLLGPIVNVLIMKGFVAIVFGLAVALLWFFESIAIERSIRRSASAKFASFARFFDRRLLSEPCGLALLRGAFLGLLLLGIDTFLVSTGTSKLGMRLDSLTQIALQAWPYLYTAWPNVHLVLDALLQAFTVGLGIGFLTSLLAGFVRRSWLTVFAAAALAAVFIVHAFYSLGAVQPYHWKLLVLLFDYLFLVFVFTRFDLLTLLAAVFTFAFWWQNYRLLVMFEPTGSGDQWLAFAVWGLVVLAAVGVAFQAGLKSGYRRLAAAFQ